MEVAVVYIRDYEDHKKMLFVALDESKAKQFIDQHDKECQYIFESRACSENMNFLIFQHIENMAKIGVKMSFNDIRHIVFYGNTLNIELVKFMNFSNGWLDFYDQFTSDFEPDQEMELLPPDYYFDWRLGVDENVDTKHVSDHKLEHFNKCNNTYKWYDPKIASDDVRNCLYWYDPIHKFCHNKGYMNAHKKVMGIIEKNDTLHVSKIIEKLKNHIEYKTNKVFNKICKLSIRTMVKQKEQYSYDIGNYGIDQNGYLFDKNKPFKNSFPQQEFEFFMTDVESRAKDVLGHIHGVKIYKNDYHHYEDLIIKIAISKTNKPIIITKCMYELFDDFNLEEWLKFIKTEIEVICFGTDVERKRKENEYA